MGTRWSAGVRESSEPCQSAGDHVGPGPVACESQVPAAGSRDHLGSGGQEAEPETAGLPPAGFSGRASMGSQAGRSSASWTVSSQIWFCAVSWRGRLRRPVARAARMRSSARARCRCRSSSAATGIPVVLVAKQVSRSPSASVTRYWAPGQGRSLLQTFSSNPLVVERAGRHHVCQQPPRVQVAPLAVSAQHLHRHHQVVVQQRHPDRKSVV